MLSANPLRGGRIFRELTHEPTQPLLGTISLVHLAFKSEYLSMVVVKPGPHIRFRMGFFAVRANLPNPLKSGRIFRESTQSDSGA